MSLHKGLRRLPLVAAVAALAACLLFFGACRKPADTGVPAVELASAPDTTAVEPPAPLPARAAVPLLLDRSEPDLLLTSPADGGYYASVIRVRGQVRGSQDESGAARRISALTWELAGTRLHGPVDLDAAGRFSLDIPASGLSEPLTMKLTAEDERGFSVEAFLRLQPYRQGPTLTLFSPADGATYRSLVGVKGRVGGSGEPADSVEEVQFLSWEIPGTDLGGPLEFDSSGAFSFSFSTKGLRRSLELKLEAVSRNGFQSRKTLTLHNDGVGPQLILDGSGEIEYGLEPAFLRGRVGYSEEEPDAISEVRSLGYELPGPAGLRGSIPFQSDGSFSLQLSAAGLQGEQDLRLTAEDWNGNRTERIVRLKPIAAPLAVQPPAPEVQHAAVPEPPPAAEGAAPAPPAAPAPVAAAPAPAPAPVPAATVTAATAPATPPEVPSPSVAAAGPYLQILAPANGSLYENELIIRGKVGNSEADRDTVNGIRGMDFAVLDAPGQTGAVLFEPNGAFHLKLPLRTLRGTLRVRIGAEDRDGRRTERLVTLLDGRQKPVLTVHSPQDQSLFGARVLVSGIFTDPHAAAGFPAAARSLTLEIYSTVSNSESKPLKLVLPLSDNGSFQTVVTTDGMIGPQLVSLSATSAGGKRAEAFLTIKPGEGGIPSFTAVPGDGTATFRWEPVPLAEEFTLFYGNGAGDPGPGTADEIRGISSPFTLSNLTNGLLYNFRLRADAPRQPEVWSALRTLIPLSPLTLLPTALGEYGQVRLTWNPIPEGCYEVWRAQAQDGEYALIGGPLSETVYVDRNVALGRRYYYRIRPAAAGSLLSAAVPGEPSVMPPRRLAQEGLFAAAVTRTLAVSGGYAYVSGEGGSLRVVDISDPTRPQQIGELAAVDPRDVALQGEYAYLADGEQGIVVVDVSDPRHPVATGSRRTIDPQGVAVLGSLALLADGRSGLKIFDVSSPYKPNRIASLETEDARRVVLRGSLAYLADAREGLVMLDLSRPAEPARLGTLPVSGAVDVSLSGSLAFTACGSQGLVVADVSDPTRPVRLYSDNSLKAAGVTINAGLAYVADEAGKMKVLDVSDPHRALELETMEAADARRIVVDRDRAYLLDGSGLKIIRLATIGKSYEIGGFKTDGAAYGVSLAGGLLFLADHQGGVKVFSAATPDALQGGSALASWKTDYAEGVAVENRLAAVADGTFGVKLFDLDTLTATAAAPAAPLGEYRSGGRVFSVALQGGRAYVAAGEKGLLILDLQNPRNPVEAGVFASADARALALSGNIGVLADGRAGLKMLDFSNTVKPVQVGAMRLPLARRVVVQKSAAFVVGSTGLSMVDISRPEAPSTLQVYETPYAEDVAVNADLLYLAEGHRGLKVFTILGTAGFNLVSECDSVYAAGVAGQGEHAFVADSTGLKVLRILIPPWLQKNR